MIINPDGPRAPTATDRYIARALKRLREHHGLSQAAVAGAAEVGFQQIQKYESAHNRVPAARLIGIADAFDCSVLDFLPDAHGTLIDPRPRDEIARILKIQQTVLFDD